MNPSEPPDDSDDAATTPTIIEGYSFEDLRGELDEQDLLNLREFFGRIEAESRRSGEAESTRLDALGPFRDLVEIGRGGMGVVYRARDPETGRDVAVKIPAPGLMLAPATRRLFDKEAEAVGRLDHPAIVPHWPVGAEAGLLYIVSDYCDGPDLERWLKARKQPVPAREAARIVRDLADAVAHAHERGVLHRDVKPSNVLLPGANATSGAESLSPRLTDFGLAKLTDAAHTSTNAATATVMVMGSPPYMAPEQASKRRGAIDARTDVYGLGALLYELLTLRPPFRGETPEETLDMVKADDPIPVRVLRRGVPRALEAITLQCLEKDPARRYPTAEALRDDLGAFLGGRGVRARRPGPVERLRRWARRRPKSASLAASALAVVLILAAGAAAGTAAWTVALRQGRDRSEQYAYVSRVMLAQRAYEDGQLVRAQPILHGLIPRDGDRDRREFAWYYLWRTCRREARMIFPVEADFHRFALSPDGSRLAYGGENDLAVQDLASESLAWQAATPGMHLDAAPAFSPDGAHVGLLLINSEDEVGRRRTVEVRSASDGDLLGRRVVPLGRYVHAVGYPRDGRLSLIVPTPTPDAPLKAELWTWSDREPLADAAPPMQFSALFACTKDGLRCLALERDGALGIHDAASRSFVPLQGGSASDISCVDFSEDGRRVAVVYGENAEIRIHDAVDGRLLHRLPPIGAPVVEVALQPGGEAILLRTTTREVRLIDERRRVDLRVFEPTTEPGVETGHIRFTPDGRTFLVHRTEYRGPDHIEIRSTQDGRRLGETPARYKARSGGWAIRSGPNPELIYGLGPHAWRWRWSRTVTPAPEDLLKAHGDETWTVAYSPDGSLLATTSNNDYERTTIRLRTPEGRVLREWRDDDGTVADLAFAPDSSWIATAHLSNARALRIRPIRGEGEVASVELPDGEWARAVDVDPNRPIVYAGGNLGTILAWNVERRRAEWRVMPPPERRVPKANERIHDLAIAPDGDRLAVVNDRGVVRILDTRHGSLLSSYEGRSPMLAVAYSPDGLTVAAADLEGWIHLLDAATGRLRQGVLGDDCDLRALAFSPDGRTLAAAGLGRVVRLWDPSTGEELLSLNGHEAQINSVAFSPDGETLASADHAGIVRFWRGPRREGR